MLDFSNVCELFFMVVFMSGLVLISVSLLLIQTELVEYCLHFSNDSPLTQGLEFCFCFQSLFSHSSKWILLCYSWDYFMCALHLLYVLLFVNLLNEAVIYSTILTRCSFKWIGICYHRSSTNATNDYKCHSANDGNQMFWKHFVQSRYVQEGWCSL